MPYPSKHKSQLKDARAQIGKKNINLIGVVPVSVVDELDLINDIYHMIYIDFT
ncbi:17369_t:CDS:2 [Entrophospora sp. SA101]|nr:17369_t:CDS:2 [Entrophospora sp. SA101]